MAEHNSSDKRRQAEQIFEEARRAYSKGRLPRAVQRAQQALEIDGSYGKVRHWLAGVYLEAGETDHASRLYQGILRADATDKRAWAALEEIDPPAAEGIKRVHEIAPDPFVARTRAEGAGDFESLEDFGDRGVEDTAGVPHLHKAQVADELESLGELAAPEAEVVALSLLWEFEQDRDYWRQWLALAPVAAVAAEIETLWSEHNAVERVLAQCPHLSPRSHPGAVNGAQTAADGLGMDPPELFLLPDRDMRPLVLRGEPSALALNTGMIRILTDAEMTFAVGRCLGWILSGYLAALQAVDLLVARPLPLASELSLTLRETFAQTTGPLTAKLTPQREQHLKAVGHAWQQRAELSADRAGLLACRDSAAARNAIARCSVERPQAATDLTADKFMAEYEGQDVQKLAAIPVAENPAASAGYAAYRIQMLQWWARTDDYQVACRRLDGQ